MISKSKSKIFVDLYISCNTDKNSDMKFFILKNRDLLNNCNMGFSVKYDSCEDCNYLTMENSCKHNHA